jgi:hypothetical protein
MASGKSAQGRSCRCTTRFASLYLANSSLLEAIALVDIDPHNVASLPLVPVNNPGN